MDYITIIQGDDTNFLEDQFIIVNFKTDFSMSGFMATFTLDNITLTYGDLSSKSLEIILSKDITSNLKIGKQYGELKLIDTKNRIRTISSVIPFLVKNGVNEKVTYINNSFNVITNINDTTLEIIVETAGIAKTEAEKVLAECNLASKEAQNGANICQNLSIKMEEYLTIISNKQEELDTSVNNTIQLCEQNIDEITNLSNATINNINEANENIEGQISNGLSDIEEARKKAMEELYNIIEVDFSAFAKKEDLSDVAISGNYEDLKNTPEIPVIPKNISEFENDVGYLTQHQDISGKENVLKTINILDKSGTIELSDNSINSIAPEGDITFLLPSNLDKTVFHQILVQLNMETLHSINLGTSYYFNSEVPDLSNTGSYNLIYEYDGTNWIVGAISKGVAA